MFGYIKATRRMDAHLRGKSYNWVDYEVARKKEQSTMAKNPLVGCVTQADFAKSMNVTVELISVLRRNKTIPADALVMQGRKVYVHNAKARAALKAAPIANKGAVPRWVAIVGNKAGIARAKELVAKQGTAAKQAA